MVSVCIDKSPKVLRRRVLARATILLVGVASLMPLSTIATERRTTRCDVAASGFCFLLPKGGTSTLGMPADLKVYDVKMQNGINVRIQSASGPQQPLKDPRQAFREIEGTKGATLRLSYPEEGKKHMDLHFVQMKGNSMSVVNVTATYTDAQKSELLGFMETFRACEWRAVDRYQCSTEKMFGPLDRYL